MSGAGTTRVVVAFDAFKGSLTAEEACAAAVRGVRTAMPDATVVAAPMADGGEGSLDALLARGGSARSTATVDAIGRPATATWILDGDEAVVELAQAAGLPQVEDAPLRPLEASTAGLGPVIRDALDAGAAGITLLLGGSATSRPARGCSTPPARRWRRAAAGSQGSRRSTSRGSTRGRSPSAGAS